MKYDVKLFRWNEPALCVRIKNVSIRLKSHDKQM